MLLLKGMFSRFGNKYEFSANLQGSTSAKAGFIQVSLSALSKPVMFHLLLLPGNPAVFISKNTIPLLRHK
jgi:hypothetical protein